jgi:tetratricopeptide (TPR) repeat protein
MLFSDEVMEPDPLPQRPTMFHRERVRLGALLRRSRSCPGLAAIIGLLWLSSITFAQTRVPQASGTPWPEQTAPKPEQSAALPTLSDSEHDLKGGETHSYRINLTAGQFLYALVEQKEIDVVVASVGPDGVAILETDSPNDRWGTEPILLIAGHAGDYRIDISSPNSKAPAGRYAIKINALRQATAADEEYVAAERSFDEGRKLRAQQTAAGRRAAVEKYAAALQGFRAVGDSYRVALTLSSIGNTYAQLNEFRKAKDYFKETLGLAQALRDHRLEAATETFLGGVDDVLGEVRAALDHYQRALSLSRESGNHSAEASALNNIGTTSIQIGDWQTALEYLLQALPLFRALGNQRTEGIALHNLGLTYSMLGEQAKALEYYQQALSLRRATGDKDGAAVTLNGIGLTFKKDADPARALDYYSQAQAIERETGNRGLEAFTLDYMGAAYAEMGQPAKALEYHQEALRGHEHSGNLQREAVALRNLGDDYVLLGQPEKGLEFFGRALSLFRTVEDRNSAGQVLERTAKVELSLGNTNAARKHIEESLALIESVRARAGSPELRASYLASMEEAYEFYIDLLMQQHAKDPAQGLAAEALRASERARARSLTELLNEAHVDVRQGVDAGLIQQERNLSEVIDAKAERQIQLKSRKGSEQEIAALDKEIGALEDQYQQVRVAIRQSSPQYAALTQPQPLDLKEIQAQLDPETVLLEYSLGETRSYVWVVTPTSLKSFALQGRREINRAAQQVYARLTARSAFRPLESASQRARRIAQADAELPNSIGELSEIVLGPLASELGAGRLVIVADGALQYVPFAVLWEPEKGGPGEGATGRQAKDEGGRMKDENGRQRGLHPSSLILHPLIVDHELLTLPSATSLAVQRKRLADRKPAPNLIAVLADPVFSNADSRVKRNSNAFPRTPDPSDEAVDTRIIEHLADKLTIRRLPFTRSEADQILAVAPQAANLEATDFKASRETVMSGALSQYRYLHFATHGYLDSERANLSAIVLSLVDDQGRPQDGFLRVKDIYNLNLPADLVVLSACETGLGKEIRGEGIDGLTRGFMFAGAARVVVSLWNVNDKATADLMAKFYEKMLKEGQRPAPALRAAQVEMWKQKRWQSPYYWAAFTMQGEWR